MVSNDDIKTSSTTDEINAAVADSPTGVVVIFPNSMICEEPLEFIAEGDIEDFSALDHKVERHRKRRLIRERAGRILRSSNSDKQQST
ncbi:hypothetical protein G9A89_000229 [Geosiphon pyriformis]|nr:hypothetical protein G9A89_000229 [Geosiphon pyriformis]